MCSLLLLFRTATVQLVSCSCNGTCCVLHAIQPKCHVTHAPCDAPQHWRLTATSVFIECRKRCGLMERATSSPVLRPPNQSGGAGLGTALPAGAPAPGIASTLRCGQRCEYAHQTVCGWLHPALPGRPACAFGWPPRCPFLVSASAARALPATAAAPKCTWRRCQPFGMSVRPAARRVTTQ